MTTHLALRQGLRRQIRLQGGAALIEVLVAFLIFSFGILGLVGLQGAMVRNQTDAKVRTDAAFLANEFVGLVQSDQGNVANYVTSTSTACSLAKCADWVRKVKSALPGGNAATVYTAGTNGGDYSITISWTSPDGSHRQYLASTSVYR